MEPPPETVDSSALPAPPFLAGDHRPAIVFGHPNHELAVFGMLQRCQPDLLYLTDGGGQKRVDETRAGLDRIGLAERATYFNYPEDRFYQALLDHDHDFLSEVTERTRQWIQKIDPTDLLCDAIEFYNPVHDLSLPLVRKATAERSVSVYEIPLIRQVPGPEVRYEIQRVGPSLLDSGFAMNLREEEIDGKMRALEQGYGELRSQLEAELRELTREHLSVEQVFRARPHALDPPRWDCILRYEWRGERLRERGEVERVILWEADFLPVARDLQPDRS